MLNTGWGTSDPRHFGPIEKIMGHFGPRTEVSIGQMTDQSWVRSVADTSDL